MQFLLLLLLLFLLLFLLLLSVTMKTEEFFVVEQMIYHNFIQHNAASLGGSGSPFQGNLSIRHFISCILVTFYACKQLQFGVNLSLKRRTQTSGTRQYYWGGVSVPHSPFKYQTKKCSKANKDTLPMPPRSPTPGSAHVLTYALVPTKGLIVW